MTELLHSKILVTPALNPRNLKAIPVQEQPLCQHSPVPLKGRNPGKPQARGLAANWRRIRAEQNKIPDLLQHTGRFSEVFSLTGNPEGRFPCWNILLQELSTSGQGKSWDSHRNNPTFKRDSAVHI